NTTAMAVLATWVGWGGLDEVARSPSHRAIQAKTLSLPVGAEDPTPAAGDEVAAKDSPPPIPEAKRERDGTKPEAPRDPASSSPDTAKEIAAPTTVQRPQRPSPPTVRPPDPVGVLPDSVLDKAIDPDASRGYKIRDENGRAVVARLHGRHGH